MKRIPVTEYKPKNYSPNLESPDSINKQKSKLQKVIIKHTINQKPDTNLASFWRLIIITSVVFCFGGLGFGMALRYGQNWQMTDSLIHNNPQQ